MNTKQKAPLPKNYSLQPPSGPKKSSRSFRRLVILVIVLVAAASILTFRTIHEPDSISTKASKSSSPAATKPVAKPSVCVGNTIAQNLIVSIGQRHMWACGGATQLYDNAVITGMENLPADLTPVGTYHIYAKTTNIVLRGSDSTGSWNDPVSYWLPFLDNQYGTYGFHDATWRKDSDFGAVSQYSSSASHGCVEMPLAAAKWLYNWATVGATVTIQS